MNLAPSFGILAVLYIVVMAVLIGLAIYVLILVITFGTAPAFVDSGS